MPRAVAKTPRPLALRFSKRAALQMPEGWVLVMLKSWEVLAALPAYGRVRPGAFCQVPTPVESAVRTWPGVADAPSWKPPVMSVPVMLALPDCAEPGEVGWSRTASGAPVMLDHGIPVRPEPSPEKEPAKLLAALEKIRAEEYEPERRPSGIEPA